MEEYLYSSELLYDTAKNISKKCLNSYDSYLTVIYPSATSEGRGDYRIYCGNIDIVSDEPIFHGYELYSYYYNSKSFSSPRVSYSFSNPNTDLDINYEIQAHTGSLSFSNIDSLHLPDYLSLDYQEIVQVDNSSDSDVSLPFEREEFIAIPFLLCILIVMLFLKWCFPMKGGKSL